MIYIYKYFYLVGFYAVICMGRLRLLQVFSNS
ncbi:hypothetical protein EMIT0357P_11227 [Pseudomonas marginalis]